MPRPCDRRSASPTKRATTLESRTRHPVRMPALGRRLGRLQARRGHAPFPTYAFITPDQCHNMHASCTRGATAIRAGDTWLSRVIPQIVQTPRIPTRPHGDLHHLGRGLARPERRPDTARTAWRAYTWPTRAATCRRSSCRRTSQPGTRSNLLFSHYSLLQTTERLLGLDPFLGHAADPTTIGMRAAFGF